jgi:hemolysin activation/secretion protein
VKFDYGKNLDRDTQLFLGNDNGLRGFPNREFVGARRFIFNIEDRVFFVNDLFHLISLGAVMFFDSGYVWERGDDGSPRDLVASAGIGLRIGIPRAAGEKVFRIDLAIPLTANGGRQWEPALSFGSGQAFQQFVGPFDLQTGSGD